MTSLLYAIFRVPRSLEEFIDKAKRKGAKEVFVELTQEEDFDSYCSYEIVLKHGSDTWHFRSYSTSKDHGIAISEFKINSLREFKHNALRDVIMVSLEIEKEGLTASIRYMDKKKGMPVDKIYSKSDIEGFIKDINRQIR